VPDELARDPTFSSRAAVYLAYDHDAPDMHEAERYGGG